VLAAAKACREQAEQEAAAKQQQPNKVPRHDDGSSDSSSMLQQLRDKYRGALTTKHKVLLIGTRVAGGGNGVLALAVVQPYNRLVSGPAPGAQHSTFTSAATAGTGKCLCDGCEVQVHHRPLLTC
jgi:hypothetical protein